MENIQVPLPATVPLRRYLLTLEALPSHSSRGRVGGPVQYVCYGKFVAGIYIPTYMVPICLGSCEIDKKGWDGKVRSRRLQVVSYFEFYFYYSL